MKFVNHNSAILIIIMFASANLNSQILKNNADISLLHKTQEQIQIQQLSQQLLSGSNVLDFDGANRQQFELKQNWDISESRWKNYSELRFKYHIDKVLNAASTLFRTRTLYHWNNENWELHSWWELFVNGDGFIEQEISYSNLGNIAQEINYYGPYTNGRAAYFISLIDWGSGLENDQRISYTYNSDGDIIEMIGESWDGNDWVFTWKGIATYNDPGCQTTWTNHNYDNGNWIANWRSTNIYGRSDCMSEMVLFQPWPLLNCNPTQFIEEVSTDNGVTWTSSATGSFSDFGADCLPRTYNYSNGYQERNYFEFTQISGGKVSSTFDNSDLRCTKKTTQNFTDGNWVNSTKTWYSYEGLILDTESETTVPDAFVLAQNYPNPFNPNTTIDFVLSKESNVTLSVYDMAGKLVKKLVNTSMQIGNHNIEWDGTDTDGVKVGAGVYLYKLQTDKFSKSRKMILLK